MSTMKVQKSKYKNQRFFFSNFDTKTTHSHVAARSPVTYQALLNKYPYFKHLSFTINSPYLLRYLHSKFQHSCFAGKSHTRVLTPPPPRYRIPTSNSLRCHSLHNSSKRWTICSFLQIRNAHLSMLPHTGLLLALNSPTLP